MGPTVSNDVAAYVAPKDLGGSRGLPRVPLHAIGGEAGSDEDRFITTLTPRAREGCRRSSGINGSLSPAVELDGITYAALFF